MNYCVYICFSGHQQFLIIQINYTLLGVKVQCRKSLYRDCFKMSFTTLKVYINLFTGYFFYLIIAFLQSTQDT
jgi:hypothetical protein